MLTRRMQIFFMRTVKTDQTAYVQADLSLRWAHMSEGTFPLVVAHLHKMIMKITLIFISVLHTNDQQMQKANKPRPYCLSKYRLLHSF